MEGEMSQPEEEEWGSYWEVTKEPGRCNARPSAMFRGQEACVQESLDNGACDTLDCQLGECWGQGQPLWWAQTPKPNTRTRQNRVGLKTAQEWSFISGPWRKEGKTGQSVIVRMRRSNSLSCSVSVSSRGRCSLDRKELGPHARKYASERWDENQRRPHDTWKQTHARTGLWPGPVDSLGK